MEAQTELFGPDITMDRAKNGAKPGVLDKQLGAAVSRPHAVSGAVDRSVFLTVLTAPAVASYGLV